MMISHDDKQSSDLARLSASLPQVYQALEIIASGGLSIIYRVFDRLRSQFVALKQLRSVPGNDMQSRATIMHEFRILSSLHHPYILSALDFGFDGDGHPFFTMPLLNGAATLYETAVGTPFDKQVHLLMQVLQALAYLHQHRIIHNDLKPNNILVVEDHVMLLDFGFASFFSDVKYRSSGTRRYFAPERLRGESSPETDFYAVGVIAFEIFSAQTPLADLTSQRQPTAEDVAQLSIHSDVQDLLARLLALDPADRKLDIGALVNNYIERSGRDLPYAELALQESFLQAAPFIGRQRELGQLLNALDAVRQHQGGLWLVRGESGIGKSRLLDELRVEALVRQIAVVRGGAASDHNRPYQWLEETVRWLRLSVEPQSKEDVILNRLLLQDVDTALSPHSLLDGAENDVLDVVEQLLKAKVEPLLVILEDIHWLTPESLKLLNALTRHIQNTSTLFVASYRPEFHQTLADEFARAHYIDLPRLSRSEMTTLITAMTQRTANEPLFAFLESETAGNPFFLVEVLRALAKSQGGLEVLELHDLAPSFKALTRDGVLQHRITSLPAWAREILPFAAVLGHSLDIDVLRAVFAGTDLDYWLTLCARWYVLKTGNDGWQFAHDYIRQSVLCELTPANKCDLHRMVAEAVEARKGTDLPSASLLAFHWREAGHYGKEAHYAARAAAFAMHQNHYREAVLHYRRALELSKDPNTGLERAALHNMLGEALFASGSMVDGEQSLQDALKCYRVRPPTLASAGYELARHIWHRVTRVHYRTVAHSDEHQQRAHLIIRACEKLAQINYVRNQKFIAIYYALLGVNLAEQLGISGQNEQARFYGSMAMSFGLVSLHPFARFYIRQADRVSVQIQAEALAWKNEAIGAYYAGCGHWDGARSRFLDILERAGEGVGKRRQLEVIGFLASIAVLQARWDELESLARTFDEVDPHKDDVPARMWNLVTRGTRDVVCGNVQSPELFDWVSEVSTAAMRLDDTATQIRALGFLTLYYLAFDLTDEAETYAGLLTRAISKVTPIAFPTVEGYIGLALYCLRRLAKTPSTETRRQARNAGDYLKIFARSFAIGRPFALVCEGWYWALCDNNRRALQLAQRGVAYARALRIPFAEITAYSLLARFLPAHDQSLPRLAGASAALRSVTRLHLDPLLPVFPPK